VPRALIRERGRLVDGQGIAHAIADDVALDADVVDLLGVAVDAARRAVEAVRREADVALDVESDGVEDRDAAGSSFVRPILRTWSGWVTGRAWRRSNTRSDCPSGVRARTLA
jgi:hypothetical protein